MVYDYYIMKVRKQITEIHDNSLIQRGSHVKKCVYCILYTVCEDYWGRKCLQNLSISVTRYLLVIELCSAIFYKVSAIGGGRG